MRNVPQNVVDFVNQKMHEVPFGEIVIKLSDNGDFVDVIVSERKRFGVDPPKNLPRPGELATRRVLIRKKEINEG